MDKTNSDEVAKQVDDELTRVMQSLTTPAVPKGQRRFRFAVGLLCLAPFCLLVAFFPWPSQTFVDKLMWVGYAFTLLVVGAWQLDKSNKESDAVARCDAQPEIKQANSGKVLPLKRQ